MRKSLLFILLFVLVFAIFYKSPVSALLNYNKAKSLYDSGQYEKSLGYFERSLFANNNAPLTRYFYVMALSKSKPKYSVQKKLSLIADSGIEDEASKIATMQTKVMKRKLLSGLEKNYIYNAVYGEGILRWDIKSFPLKVYIEGVDTVPEYYLESIKEAFNVWVKSTNFVKFTYVDTKNSANIVITFKDIVKNDCTQGGCKYVVAYTEPIINTNNVLSHMNLTFYRTNPRNEGFSKTEIFNTAVHEIGHTLGLMGHSDNVEDVMYAQKDEGYWYENFKNNLSVADVQTLVLLYRLEPQVSNVANLKSESFYYAPLILGSNDVLFEKKLDELKAYIAKYPNIAAGYINIAAVYSDLGDFDNALKSLNSAENCASTQDEKYLVAYNRAITYYNIQEYKQSFDFANVAKSIKDTQGVRDLIQELEAKLN